MKLRKDDYMRLPKERLAELLVEADNRPTIEFIPAPGIQPAPGVPMWPNGPLVTYTDGTAFRDKGAPTPDA